MLVTFSNDPRQPYTPAQARAQLDIADAFFQENSYGQTSLAVDVFGWYTLPIGNTTCDRTQIATYARQAANPSVFAGKKAQANAAKPLRQTETPLAGKGEVRSFHA